MIVSIKNYYQILILKFLKSKIVNPYSVFYIEDFDLRTRNVD